MDLYEYQGKELFRRFGIPVSDGRLATTPAEARHAAEELGPPVVVKAQVLVGGRGKAGGIKLADSAADAERTAYDILGMDIRGHVVHKVWIEKASDIAREYYLSVTFDRGEKQVLAIVGRLYECFVACDAMLCEINPLIVTPEGDVRALDSKFTVDDNALYKHPEIAEMRDLDAYPPEERAAREKDVTYVKLDGD